MVIQNAKQRTRPLWLRVIVILCVILTGWHVFATFLWIAPANALREIVPGKALSNYMLPIFGQSWSVFAPEPINGNITIKVRAAVGDKEKPTTTEWVDASATELDLAHHNLFPPRAAILGVQQATEYKSAFDKLAKEQQKTVANGYFLGDDWLKRLESDLMASGKNDAKGANIKATRAFIDQEERTSAYATQVALAVWGTDTHSVQFEVSRQNITPFKDRHNENAAPQPIRVVESGWRGLHTFPGQNTAHFAKIFSDLETTK